MQNQARSGTAALLVGHCAGMLDLVALPIWIGALVGWFRFDPQQAGLLASLFLLGQVVSSVVLAPRFARIPATFAATAGFALAAIAFVGVASTRSFPLLGVLHLLGGLGAGCALSVTHGTIGRSANPHRLFAAAGLALAVSGIFIMGGGTKLVAVQGGAALFLLFAGIMLIAALLAGVAFPATRNAPEAAAAAQAPLSRRVWFGMVGMGLMTLAQASMFSFVERLGMDRGYGVDVVSGVLIAAGLVNLLPAPLAALLQNRLRAEHVVVAGPLVHAAAVLAMSQVQVFPVYAVVVAVLIAVAVFTHTFLFGLLAQLDPSGRAVAATPAMVMIGSAVGPLLGGTIVKFAGYGALGATVACIGVVSALVFSGVRETRGERAALHANA